MHYSLGLSEKKEWGIPTQSRSVEADYIENAHQKSTSKLFQKQRLYFSNHILLKQKTVIDVRLKTKTNILEQHILDPND